VATLAAEGLSAGMDGGGTAAGTGASAAGWRTGTDGAAVGTVPIGAADFRPVTPGFLAKRLAGSAIRTVSFCSLGLMDVMLTELGVPPPGGGRGPGGGSGADVAITISLARG